MAVNGNYLQNPRTGETTVYTGSHAGHVWKFLEFKLSNGLHPRIGFRVRCVDSAVKVICDRHYRNEVEERVKQLLSKKIESKRTKLGSEDRKPLYFLHA